MKSTRVLGPLDRGHDPVVLVESLLREEVPAGAVIDVRLEGNQVIARLGTDRWQFRHSVTLDVLNQGHGRHFARMCRARWDSSGDRSPQTP